MGIPPKRNILVVDIGKMVTELGAVPLALSATAAAKQNFIQSTSAGTRD